MTRGGTRLIAAALVLALGLALAGCQNAHAPLESVAVLPLENQSPDPEESDYLADGISQSVITRLAQVGLRVTPWDTARRYRSREETLPELARELNVDAVLHGSFQLVGERLLTRLTLVEASSGLVSWAQEFEETYSDLFQVQRLIAEGAATSLKRSLTGEEREVLAEPESKSVEAYDLYLQGAHHLQAGDEESAGLAEQYFTEAVALDPQLAEAHVGLGAVEVVRYSFGWASLASLEHAQASFERALDANPRTAGARRGLVQVHYYRGASEEALQQGRDAARLAATANDLDTLLVRAEAYNYAGLPELAIPLFERVIELDPRNQGAYYHVVIASVWVGHWQRVINVGDVFLREFGDEADILFQLAIARSILGEEERAREHFERSLELEGRIIRIIWAGLFSEKHGDSERARELYRRALEQARDNLALYPDNSIMRYVAATAAGLVGERDAFAEESEQALMSEGSGGHVFYHLVTTHVRLGESERALAILRDALERRSVNPFWKNCFTIFGVPVPDTEAWRAFERDHDALVRELSEAY